MKPCPFCAEDGQEYGSLEVEDLSTPERDEWAVRCQFCGAFGPPADNPEDARQAWDKRARGEEK